MGTAIGDPVGSGVGRPLGFANGAHVNVPVGLSVMDCPVGFLLETMLGKAMESHVGPFVGPVLFD